MAEASARPVLRWLGGKFRDAPKIIAHFPPHRIYAELFGGAFSVGLAKPRAYNETYNDLDGELVNLFQVLRGPDGGELLRQLAPTPYATAEYRLALQSCNEPLERARRTVVRSHMAHGTGSARMDRPTGFRVDGRTATTNVAGEWARLPDALNAVIDRLRGTCIRQEPAIKLMDEFDDEKALIYLDPPYLPDTRSVKSRKGGERYHTYAHEMTAGEHDALLAKCCASSAMIVLSGYPHPQYDEALRGWQQCSYAARAHRNSPRIECIWLNPVWYARMTAVWNRLERRRTRAATHMLRGTGVMHLFPFEDGDSSSTGQNNHRHRRADRVLPLFPDRCGAVDYARKLERRR